MEHTLYILLGGNIGNTRHFFKIALGMIEKSIGKITKASSLYETEPWGFEHPNNFLNQAIRIKTELSPEEVLLETKAIEKKLGREQDKNSADYQARNIDIDILFYNNLQVSQENLTIPHPEIENRNFTLVPMVEIAGEFVHPKLQLSMKHLLDKCKDRQQVKKL